MLFAAQHPRTSSASLYKLSQHATDTQAVAYSHTALAFSIKPRASLWYARASSRERGSIDMQPHSLCFDCRSGQSKRKSTAR